MASFSQFVIALIVFLIILAVIGEPYSTWLAGVTILALIYKDYQVNGNLSLSGLI